VHVRYIAVEMGSSTATRDIRVTVIFSATCTCQRSTDDRYKASDTHCIHWLTELRHILQAYNNIDTTETTNAQEKASDVHDYFHKKMF
jgi:hypothetical protein